MIQIADFHCDLLSYLAGGKRRTVNDPESHASIPMMHAGGVELQTLAVYTKTAKGSAIKGSKQIEVFLDLPKKNPLFVLSIENASSFCEEDEPLEQGIKRLEKWLEKTGKIAYISMTWNEENRFGGGNATKTGLKPDGKQLLRWMEGKKIAIDLSHTSDRLAEEILMAIEGKEITPVASHSNFRSVADHPRNLPDILACEIGARGGLIGLNFVRFFLGARGSDDFLRQIEHADKLGLLDHFCLGADFFPVNDLGPDLEYLMPMFYPGFDTAACYPKVVDLLLKYLPEKKVEKIAYQNLSEFLQ